MQKLHYAAVIQFLNQEGLVMALYRHCGQYQLGCVYPERLKYLQQLKKSTLSDTIKCFLKKHKYQTCHLRKKHVYDQKG